MVMSAPQTEWTVAMPREDLMHAHVTQCRHLQSLAERALLGLGDAHLAHEPAAGCKTAGWLVGHLAVTGDFARRLCGRAPLCPKEWRALFNPGTEPSHDPAIYPAMSQLCDAVRTVYADLCDAAMGADQEVLAGENPFAPTRTTFPTSGEFVQYLLTGHFGYHLGQLVIWRAAAGLEKPPRADVQAA